MDIDNSLRGNAMRRASEHRVPKTLTPYEWQEWYAEHGVPEGHRVPGREASERQRPWLEKWLSVIGWR